MTQLTGRTEDVHERAASTCWCWQEVRCREGGEEIRGGNNDGGWQQIRAPRPAAPVQAGKQPSGPASFLSAMVSQSRALTAPRDGVRAPSVPSTGVHGDLSVGAAGHDGSTVSGSEVKVPLGSWCEVCPGAL